MTVQIAFAIMRRFVLKGTLHISIRDGDPTGAKCQLVGRYDGAQVGITLADEATMWRIVRQPDIAIGEAYMDGSLTIDGEDLDSLMHLLLDNYAHWDDQWVGRVSRALYRLRARFHLLNPPSKAQRNVAHHYDLSDALFASFLDPWRQYSCAYYDGPDTTLATAQQTKIARLAAKLDLRCGDHILDIGSGWGGLAIGFDACVPDLDVTGITLSREQHAFATTAAQKRGISDRVRFALRDYRHQQGHFDKIVSVGMLEHVGPANYHTYFRSIQQLLQPNGVALVHSIAVYCNPQPVNRWISKYIFPGGFLPSIEQLVTAAAGAGLKVLDMEVMRTHYARTLRDWRTYFVQNQDTLSSEYDDIFIRMWLFYLAGCEYFFRCQYGMVVQLLVARDDMAVPSNRRYIEAQQDRFKDILCKTTPFGNTPPSPK